MSNWGEILKISKSQLTTYLQCPRKYRFQYVEGRDWEFIFSDGGPSLTAVTVMVPRLED